MCMLQCTRYFFHAGRGGGHDDGVPVLVRTRTYIFYGASHNIKSIFAFLARIPKTGSDAYFYKGAKNTFQTTRISCFTIIISGKGDKRGSLQASRMINTRNSQLFRVSFRKTTE